MEKKRAIPRIIFSSIAGLIFFFILLAIANYLSFSYNNNTFYTILDFINSNVWLIVVYSLYFMVGRIFYALMFPFNLPGPIFNSVGAYYLTGFIVDIIGFTYSLSVKTTFYSFSYDCAALKLLVFFIVLITGYISILLELVKVEEKKKRKKKEVSWIDVGEEFKQAFFYLGKRIKESLKKKK